MGEFCKIHDLAAGLNGLIVEGRWTSGDEHFVVVQIYNTDVVLGDRIATAPVAEGGLLIKADFLEETTDPRREFSTKSPFGKYLYEGTFVKGTLNITYMMFDNAFTVTILEKKDFDPDSGNLKYTTQKTLFSQSFFSGREIAHELIEAVLYNDMDPEDLIFELELLKKEDKIDG